MIKIQTSDGQTHKIDIKDDEDSKKWLKILANRKFQSTIRAISVVGQAGTRVRCPCCQKAGNLHCFWCESDVSKEARTSVGVQYTLTRPDGYTGPVYFVVEDVESDLDTGIRGGERVTCFAGDTRIQMMVHAGQPSMRMTTTKVGRQRYNPFLE